MKYETKEELEYFYNNLLLEEVTENDITYVKISFLGDTLPDGSYMSKEGLALPQNISLEEAKTNLAKSYLEVLNKLDNN